MHIYYVSNRGVLCMLKQDFEEEFKLPCQNFVSVLQPQHSEFNQFAVGGILPENCIAAMLHHQFLFIAYFYYPRGFSLCINAAILFSEDRCGIMGNSYGFQTKLISKSRGSFFFCVSHFAQNHAAFLWGFKITR